MKKYFPIFIVGALLFSSCDKKLHKPPSSDPRGDDYVVGTVAPISDVDAGRLAVGESMFAVDMLERVSAEYDNCVVSPMSLYMALALVGNGSAGETERQIASALDADGMDGVLALCSRQIDSFRQMGGLTEEEERLLSTVEGEKRQSILENLMQFKPTVRVANSLWVSDEFPLYPSFVKEAERWLDAKAWNVDFSSTDANRNINAWVKESTKGMVPALVDESRPLLMPMIAANCLYLDAKWKERSFAKRTSPLSFINYDGTVSQVENMAANVTAMYCESGSGTYISLPLGENDMSFNVYFGRDNALEALKGVDAKGATSKEILLTMPVFEVSSDIDQEVTRAFKAMGIVDAFDIVNADFSRLSGDAFALGQVLHRARIKVCETGVQAAAATAFTSYTSGSEHVDPLVVTIDGPFAFTVTDSRLGTVLFAGTVNKL